MHDTLHSAISAYNESNHFINLLRYDGKCSELVMYCIWMSASERNDHESIVFIFYTIYNPTFNFYYWIKNVKNFLYVKPADCIISPI